MSDAKIIKTIHNYQMRIRLLSVFAVIALFTPPVGAAVVGTLAANVPDLYIPGNGILWLLAAVACFAFFLVAGRAVDKQKKKLKLFVGEYVIKGIIAEQIDIREYDPNGCYYNNFLRSSGILPAFDKSYGSDYIKGIYKGREITYCDIKLESEYDTTDSEGNSEHETVTVFQGPVISLALGRSLGDKRVRILERRNKRRRKGFMSDLFATAADALGIKAKESMVSMENEAFNNQFEVKTNDEEFAFYILTPQFMENIVSADKLAEGHTNICFGGDKANIAIHNDYDAFEIGKKLYNKKQLEESRERMRNDLNKVLLIVDEILKKDKLF